MKKIIYTALLVFASLLAITSCTEEQVTPSNDNGGGGGSTEPIKP